MLHPGYFVTLDLIGGPEREKKKMDPRVKPEDDKSGYLINYTIESDGETSRLITSPFPLLRGEGTISMLVIFR